MRRVVLLMVLVALGGCGLKMADGEPRNRREIPPGPGVFTGERGEWVLYRNDAEPPPEPAGRQ